MSRALPLLVAAAAAAAPLVAATAPAADAAPTARYRNCAQLNRDYPHGVGKKGAVDKANGGRKAHPVRNFKVDTRLYNSLSKSLDRDRDGIACEKGGSSSTPTKKAPAKKAPAKKVPAKKAPAKKVPAKKTSKGRAVSSPTGFAFVTPSGNIRCLAGPSDVRCDITEIAYRLPQTPSWCPTDYGQSFGLYRDASILCAGDTIAGTASPRQNWFLKTGLKPLNVYGEQQAVLPYGWTVKGTQIACTSTTKGVTCTNSTTRHGFTISKAAYKVF
ncbi:excalibur calcium-binding domain-containing protein [Mobilicoccus sp.]|uniref:excalibur calcium-binding domain-containing protein n=1 Tax=Mobilicoccus sp. TaxID=2034349 RepID=UPI0028A78FAF|nr:excalibur calcium-binding domain-containing protein [Mobilicoccus sp.]